jgi:lipoprotein-anchoring transpeptidase ErfK/SrfK
LRLVLAVFALLVPLIPIAIGLTIGSGSSPAVAAAAPHPFVPVSPPPRPRQPNLLLPPGNGPLVALVTRHTEMRTRPNGPMLDPVPLQTQFGSPNAMWVERLSGSWLGVVSVQAGNNRLGWIPASAASLSRINWEMRVSLSHRLLTVLLDGRAVEHYTVAIGMPDAPTPTGRFAVTDRLRTGNPAGPYGCCILALSAIAPHAIQGWNGGNRIAIHSTPETGSIGEAASHGCLRLTLAEGQWLLAHIPLGTPTLIST